jgi:hypothetical protein
MRRPYLLLPLLLLAAPAAARAQHAGHHPAPAAADSAKVTKDAHAAGGWKEMDAFHTQLAATWHPASKSDDLKPLRERAGALADAARAWAAAAVPKACDTPETRTTVAALATDARALADLVAKPTTTDAQLKASLKALHDRFEPVEQGCAPGGAAMKHH